MTRLRHVGRAIMSAVIPDPLLLINYASARRHLEALQAGFQAEPSFLSKAGGVGTDSIRRWANWTHDRVIVPPAVEPADLVRGWRGGRAESMSIPELRDLVHFERWERVSVEIQDIKGLSASKSDLRTFESLDDMADRQCAGLLQSNGDDRLHLARLMSHSESRIFHDASEEVVRHGWDGRLMLSNAGGSHHFTAARRLAGRIGRQVWCEVSLRTETLDPAAVAGLRKHYHIVAVPTRLDGPLHDVAMSTGAAYYRLPMPRPDVRLQAIFLPRDNPASGRLAGQLIAAGAPDVLKALEDGLKLQASLQSIDELVRVPERAPCP